MGLNSRAGLAAVEAVVRQRVNARHMANGVTLVDPRATYIDVDVEIGADSVIFPNIVPRAGLAHRREVWHRPVGRDVGFDRGRRLGRAVLGAGWCDRRRGCEVGPFARLRDGTVLDDGAQVGNYVEVKATTLGRGAKAKHLTYLGDAEIGDGANIGAGTVTVNYDGYSKHTTVVGSGAGSVRIRCWWRP